ncbi:MAG: aldehyde dehydrogenase [Gammaproteobacteria bacterium]|nr:aldehyde dehydrogenase [Gammaproteobacteria bacterium]
MHTVLQAIESTRYSLFIGGDWVEPISKRHIESFDPSSGEPWYELPDSGPEDVDRAVQAARRALADPVWRRLTQTARGKLVRQLGDLLAERAPCLAEIETRDNGKLIREMRAQLASLPDVYYYFSGMADKIQGDVIPINKPDMLNYTMREPVGVVAIIVPWNSPLYLLTSVLAPCLAIGNTVVIKPSEHTSASALEFAKLVGEAGFPPGVVNIVTGYGETAGEALTAHPGVDKIAFTGGTDTGRRVATNAAAHLAPCALELGGKSPHVVFQDADLERAASGIVAGIFAAAGQTCIAGSRCFIHQDVYDDLLHLLVHKAKHIKIGHPMEEQTELGPLALKDQLEKVNAYVSYGREDGAELICGGKQPAAGELSKGWYFEPTIFTGVENNMRIARDEIFGPVLAVMPFNNETQLIEAANDTSYGLAAGIWTQDIDRAMRFARDVNSGTVWVNTYRSAAYMSPAGGFKHSGYGKHNGFEAIREYSRLKNVVIDYSGKTQDPFVLRLR